MRRPRTKWLALASGLIFAGSAGALALPALAADTTGTMTVSLSDGGVPVDGTFILDDDSGNRVDTESSTGGAFTFVALSPGSYRVGFSLPGTFTQWHNQKLSEFDGDVVTVAAGTTVDVHETLVAHGSLTGRVTSADGSPAANAQVGITTFSNTFPTGVDETTTTNSDGIYTFGLVPTGDYRVSFRRNPQSPTQYANNTYSYASATAIAVTAGPATQLNQSLVATGAITGHLTDHNRPVANALVSALATDGSGIESSVATAADGTYRLEAPPGTYTVRYEIGTGLVQYAHHTVDPTKAAPIAVASGADTVVDERVLPTGTVTGHLTDSTGSVMPYVPVSLTSATGSFDGMTDESGAYQIKVYAGTYTEAFTTPLGVQWAHGKTAVGLADPILVSADTTAVADEQLAAPGAVRITLVDSVSHSPITEPFCAYLSNGGYGCTSDGTVVVDQVLPGSHNANIYGSGSDSSYVFTPVTGIVVASGATTVTTVVVDRAATVATRIVDTRTGAPVSNACVQLIPVLQPSYLSSSSSTCSDVDGAVSVGGLAPGQYKEFVTVTDGVHGDQWVGPTGGVGAFKRAATVTVAAGDGLTLSPVKLDRSGSIAGTITDSGTGLPLAGASVCASSLYGGSGVCAQSAADGHYTFSGLGPYQWTLFLTAPGHASVFSGGGVNRDRATSVRVRADAATQFDAALGAGTMVRARVLGPTGGRVTDADVLVVNATTGDVMGQGTLVRRPYGAEIPVSGPQKVKIIYFGNAGGVRYAGYAGGADFATATVYDIPATGSKTVTVTMTTVSAG